MLAAYLICGTPVNVKVAVEVLSVEGMPTAAESGNNSDALLFGRLYPVSDIYGWEE